MDNLKALGAITLKRLLTIAFLVIVTFLIFSQGLDEFQLPTNLDTQKQEQKQPYWIHKTLLKTVLVIAFSVAGFIAFKIDSSFMRYIVMISALIVNGFIMGGFLCPITTVQNVLFKFTTGYLFLFLTPVVFSVFFGRIHCGFVCPFGMVQEFINFITVKMPKKIEIILRKTKYFILFALIAGALIKGDLIVRDMPYREIFNFEFSWLLVFWVMLAIIIYRPFCKYLCPYGALLGIVSKFSLYKFCVNESRCVHCKMCERVCKIDAIENERINRMECVMCGRCTGCCSKEAIGFSVKMEGRNSV